LKYTHQVFLVILVGALSLVVMTWLMIEVIRRVWIAWRERRWNQPD